MKPLGPAGPVAVLGPVAPPLKTGTGPPALAPVGGAVAVVPATPVAGALVGAAAAGAAAVGAAAVGAGRTTGDPVHVGVCPGVLADGSAVQPGGPFTTSTAIVLTHVTTRMRRGAAPQVPRARRPQGTSDTSSCCAWPLSGCRTSTVSRPSTLTATVALALSPLSASACELGRRTVPTTVFSAA